MSVRGMDSIERHNGKMVVRATIPTWWKYRHQVRMKLLWLLQTLAMTAKYLLTFGVVTFFVLWITDIYYILWPACMIVLIFSVLLFSRVVKLIKKERGVF